MTQAAFFVPFVLCLSLYAVSSMITGATALGEFFPEDLPGSVLGWPGFLIDIAVGIVQTLFAALTLDVGFPEFIRWPLAVICGTFTAIGVYLLIVEGIGAVIP